MECGVTMLCVFQRIRSRERTRSCSKTCRGCGRPGTGSQVVVASLDFRLCQWNFYCSLSRFPTLSTQCKKRCVIGWPKMPKHLGEICRNDSGRRQTCVTFCPSLVQIFRFTALNVPCAQNERAGAFLVFPCINLLRIKDDVSL